MQLIVPANAWLVATIPSRASVDLHDQRSLAVFDRTCELADGELKDGQKPD